MMLKNIGVSLFSVLFFWNSNVWAGDIDILKKEADKLKELVSDKNIVVKIDYKEPMRVGYYDASVAQLRDRLVDEGYGAIDEVDPYLYDEYLAAAVSFYQEDRGLVADGVAGLSTISSLNDSNYVRYEKLMRSISELQRVDFSNGKKIIIVNIPTFNLRAYDGDEVFIDSKVIVGKKTRQTPVIKTKLTQLKINPDWTVPTSILKKDYFYKIKEFEKYNMEHRGYYIADKDGGVVDFNQVAMESFDSFVSNGYRLKQSAGDGNALGRVKFVLSNSDAIYLHDTNNRKLFNSNKRDLSSGCIRVENYMELASWSYGGYISDIEEKISSGKTLYLNTKDTDVYLMYLPAFIVNGKIKYSEDIYGLFNG